MTKSIINALNKNADEKEVVIGGNDFNKKWWPDDVSVGTKLREGCCERAAAITQSADGWDNRRKERNRKVSIIRRRSEEKCCPGNVEDVGNNPRRPWKTLKGPMDCKRNSTKSENQFDQTIISSHEDAAEKFNNFHVNGIENVVTCLKQSNFANAVDSINLPCKLFAA